MQLCEELDFKSHGVGMKTFESVLFRARNLVQQRNKQYWLKAKVGRKVAATIGRNSFAACSIIFQKMQDIFPFVQSPSGLFKLIYVCVRISSLEWKRHECAHLKGVLSWVPWFFGSAFVNESGSVYEYHHPFDDRYSRYARLILSESDLGMAVKFQALWNG